MRKNVSNSINVMIFRIKNMPVEKCSHVLFNDTKLNSKIFFKEAGKFFNDC